MVGFVGSRWLCGVIDLFVMVSCFIWFVFILLFFTMLSRSIDLFHFIVSLFYACS